jgi:WD40-like Beta Propeller Repeat
MPKKFRPSRLGLSGRIPLAVLLLLLLAAPELPAQSPNQYAVLRKPTVSKTQIAFSYGGDLWIVSRSGGEARRLTSDVGIEIDPVFSPDGTMVAFTGEYDGNEDVYVVPAAGGIPKRLTNTTGAARLHPSGLRSFPTPASRKCRARTRTIPLRCGWATRSIFFRTAMDP